MKSKLLLGLVLSLSVSTAWATPAQILIIRHAEKPANGPDLDDQGYQRAKLLVNYFETTPAVLKYGTPVAIYAAEPGDVSRDVDASNRPLETVTPLAQALGLKINDSFTHDQTQEVAQDILSNPAYDGKMVLICWEHKKIIDIVQALGVSPLPGKWPGTDFGTVYEINFSGDQFSSFSQFSEHLMPDDG